MTIKTKRPKSIKDMTSDEKLAHIRELDRLELMKLVEEQSIREKDSAAEARRLKALPAAERRELERVRVLHMRHKGRRAGTVGRVSDSDLRDLEQSQLARIIAKFGGVAQMHACIERHAPKGSEIGLSTIYSWNVGTKNHKKGVVPHKYMGTIARAARMEGVFIGTDDFNPNDRVVRNTDYNI